MQIFKDMRNKTTKVLLSFLLLVVFLFNQIFSYLPFLNLSSFTSQIAEAKPSTHPSPDKVNIVAVLVDDSLYPKIKSEVSRYADYIQKWGNNAIANAKALVIPINIKEITAPDIVKILENLYFDGLKDQPSILKWVILVWDIPFPVVDDNGFIFPTIYPYVDFEKQKFIRDNDKKYFVPNEQTDSQPEVFHWLIKYNTVSGYTKFFSKIKKYDSNPSEFIGKNIWYEDSIANKKSYLDEIQSTYINNWIFAEDIAYHRYTNLFLKIIQKINEGELSGIVNNLGVKWMDGALQQTVQNVPTLMIAKTLKESGIKPYNMLRSTKLLTRIRNNLRYANRWIERYKWRDGKTKERLNRDSHIQKIALKDELLAPYNSTTNNFFVDLNNYLEKEVNDKVEKEQYFMYVPLPLEYLDYERELFKILWTKITTWKKYNAYKNYFFWKKAKDIDTIQDASIYRWTYRNLKSLDGVNIASIQKSQNPATDVNIDLSKKSIGGSYDIFSQQIEANRGFNYLNAKNELEIYEQEKDVKENKRKMVCKGLRIKGFCLWRWKWKRNGDCDIDDKKEQKDCESIYDFAMRNWWGASSLNIKSVQEKTWGKPYHYTGAKMSIFDIAWSIAVKDPEYWANSFKVIQNFTNFIQEKFSGKGKYTYRKLWSESMSEISPDWNAYSTEIGSDILVPNTLPEGNLHKHPSFKKTMPLWYDVTNYFKLFPTVDKKDKQWKVIKLQKGDENTWKIWTFKTIDSRIYNRNTEAQYIQWKKYKVFKNKNSPQYQLYKKLILLQQDKISQYDPKTSWSWYLARIIEGLWDIKNQIQQINTNLNKVHNFDIKNIENYTGQKLVALWEKWKHSVAIEKVEDTKKAIKELKVLITEFEEYLADFSLRMIKDALSKWIQEYEATKKDKKIDPLEKCDRQPANIYTYASYKRIRREISNPWTYSDPNGYNECNGYKMLSPVKRGVYDIVCGKLKDIESMKEEYICEWNPCIIGLDTIDEDPSRPVFLMGEYDYKTKVCKYKENLLKPKVAPNKWVDHKVVLDIPEKKEQYKKYPIWKKWINKRNSNFDILKSNLEQLQKNLQEVKKVYNQIPNINNSSFSEKFLYLKNKYNCSGEYVWVCRSLIQLDKFVAEDGDNINKWKSDLNNFSVSYDDKKQYYGVSVLDKYISGAKKKFFSETKEFREQLKDKTETTTDGDMLGENLPMNITTADRPIDSPRYLTFQGIGWDLVKFIYPTLYKVEVFKEKDWILMLKTPEEIEQSMRSYLKKSVKKYNEYLIKQQQKKSVFYGKNAKAFDMLETLQKLSSPKSPRSYKLFSEDYLIKKLEQRIQKTPAFKDDLKKNRPLLLVAKMLWYQNLPRKEKHTSSNIWKDIKFALSDFNINNKIQHTVSEYLKRDNYQGKMLTPWYKKDWYEVAYINSDGDDYIRTEKNIDTSRIEEQMHAYQNIETINFGDSIYDQQDQDLEITEQCVKDEQGALLIDMKDMSSPRLKAFECWLEKTLNSPFELEVSRPSGVDWLTIDSFKNFWKSFAQPLVDDVKKTLSMNQRKWKALWVSYENNEILKLLPESQSKKLEEMYAAIQPKLTNTSVFLDDPTSELIISSTKALWPIKFTISSVGELELKIKKWEKSEWNTIWEKNPLVVLFDPIHEKKFQLSAIPGPVGYNVITIEMCHQKIGKCLKKTLKFHTVPGKLEKIKLSSPDKKILAWSTSKIAIQWTDKYWNNVGQLIGNYFLISSNIGKFGIRAPTENPLRFSDFREQVLRYSVPKSAAGSVAKLMVKDKLTNKIYDTEQIKIVEGKLNIDFWWKKWNTLQKAPKFEIPLSKIWNYIYHDNDTVQQLKYNILPKVSIQLTDINGQKLTMSNTITITTKNKILSPGTIVTRAQQIRKDGKKQKKKKYHFLKKNSFILKDGKLEVYFLPSLKAGQEIITINIPWVFTHNIPINILPWKPTQTFISFDKRSIFPWESFNAYVSIKDQWGNLLDKEDTGNLSFSTIGLKILDKKKITGGLQLTMTDTWWWEWTLITRLKNIPITQQRPAIKKIVVKHTYLPKKNLNVMYLNLFGSDRGNQRGYFSENKTVVNQMMDESEKVLATTTLLTKPENIKRKVWSIEKNSQIHGGEHPVEMTIKNNNIVYTIGDIATLSNISKDFHIQQIQNIQQIAKNNTLYYIPNSLDSIITENAVKSKNNEEYIMLNGEKIFSLKDWWAEGVRIYSSYSEWNYTIFNVLKDEVSIGKFILFASQIDKWKIEIRSSRYQIYPLRWKWSTNAYDGVGIFDMDSVYQPSIKLYDSIEDSEDSKKEIWFWPTFKNITNFGAGLSVGAATVPFSSEFLINIGDPLIRRIDNNIPLKTITSFGRHKEIDYSWGIGNIIKSFPEKRIKETFVADFDNDWEQDIIILFNDSSIRRLKKYASFHDYQDMGELMRISEWIKKIVLWNTNGDNYPDILIFTKSNKIRVYTNDHGIIDVDGVPVCLNINTEENKKTETPQQIDTYQLFFEDMDRDGNIDILTYDHAGFIKITYGWKNSYVSKDRYQCDPDWYERVNKNTKILKKFWVTIDTHKKIVDDTIIRRQGLTTQQQWNTEKIPSKDLGIDTSALQKYFDNGNKKPNAEQINDIVSKNLKFDANVAIEKYTENIRPILKNQLGIKPFYEKWAWNIWYLKLRDLKAYDPVKAYKQYITSSSILKKWDKIQVKVTIQAKKDFVGTYSDTIKWPRKIRTSKDGSISRFAFDKNTVSQQQVDNLKIHWNMDTMNYIIDNIKLAAGKKLVWIYELEYIWTGSPVKIKVKDIDGAGYKDIDLMLAQYRLDDLPDILIVPQDGCVKKQNILFNNTLKKHRSYDDKTIDIQKYMEKQQQKKLAEQKKIEERNRENISRKLTKRNFWGVMEPMETWQDFGFSSEEFTLENIFENGEIDISSTSDLAAWAIDGMLLDSVEKVDKFMDGLCNGFGQWGGGIPLPFNQAFLAPWNYHLFGCYDLPPVTKVLWKWWPALSMPGNWPLPWGWYIPAPNIFWFPFRWVGDWHLWWPKQGPYSSLFRLYMIPTLTAKMAVGMCFGPYGVGMSLPSPIGDMWGNCIVTMLWWWEKKSLDNVDHDGSQWATNQRIDSYLSDLSTCKVNPPKIIWWYRASPFGLIEGKVSGWYHSYIPQDSYMWGMFQFDINPIINNNSNQISQSSQWLDFEELILQWGAENQNKITGGKSGGIIKKLIEDWMDKQTRYIINNLTKMNITVVLPKFWKIFEGYGNVLHILVNTKEELCKERNGKWDGEACQLSEKTRCENRWRKRINGKCGKATGTNAKGFNKISNLMQSIENSQTAVSNSKAMQLLNISEQLEEVFNEIPLVNIRSENLAVNIPMLGLQDIEAYILKSKNWIKRQKLILKQWWAFFVYFSGECGKKWNDRPSICKDLSTTLDNFLRFKHNINQVIEKVEKNIHTLNLYKKFPGKLYKMVHVHERYLSEISGVINAFVGTLGMWMKTNAIRISGYVDALITIITVLETYQILIDFPVERKEKCWTCTVDTYDQYSCKLWFLCPKIPVLPIPPFKIPNIKVDLSDINIGLDIKLPKFSFTTHPVTLPNLPDIPTPPDFGVQVKFDLGLNIDIPLLPEPPELPELPSFIPNIKMKLPLIPPAPRIPKIPNKLTQSIKLAKSIGKVMCIVKRKIGLVAEQSLKAKVEQITQREYEIPLRDAMDITPKWLDDTIDFLDETANTEVTDAPLKGFDLEVSSHVNLEYNFEPIYAIFEWIIEAINSVGLELEHWWENQMKTWQKWLNDAAKKGQDYVDEKVKEKIEKWIEGSIEWVKEWQKWVKKQLSFQLTKYGALSKYPLYRDTELQDSALLKDLEKSMQYQEVPYNNKIAQETKSNIKEGLIQLAQNTKRPQTSKRIKEILSLMDKDTKVKYADIEQIGQTAQNIITQQKTELHTLAQTIKTDYKTFYTSLSNRRTVGNDVNVSLRTKLFSFNDELKTTKKTTSATATSSVGWDAIKMDLAPYFQGIYVPFEKGKMVSAVKSKKFAKKIKKRYKIIDINNDAKKDILLRDDQTIYVKYHKDTDEKVVSGWGHYVFPITSQTQLRSLANQYVTIWWAEFKLYAHDYEPKNFITKGQSYEEIILWRDNKNYQKKDAPDGYMLRMNNRADTFFEKEYLMWKMRKQLDKQYVLVLPDDVDYTGKNIQFENGNKSEISKVLTGTILHVGRYNVLDEKISVKIPQYQRKRKYLEIATLHREGDTYYINAPFSNQVVAGSERSSDIQWPTVFWELDRTAIEQQITEELVLEGFVGTHYDFNIYLKDNILLSGVQIFDERNNLLIEKSLTTQTAKIFVEKLFFTKQVKKTYTIIASDIEGNITKTKMQIIIKKPKIVIDDVVGSPSSKEQTTFPVKIVAKLSNDIDEGIVNFYGKRNNRKILQWQGTKGKKDYFLKPLLTTIVGWTYLYSNAVSFVNPAWSQITTIDPNTWKVTIPAAETEKYEQQLYFTKSGPVITIYNKKEKKVEFDIQLPSKKLVDINESTLEKVPLKNQSFGIFQGGWALKKWNVIYMYVSPSWEIVTVQELTGRYEYEPLTQTVKYYFANQEKNIPEGYIQVKIKNFENYLNYK